MSLKIDANMSAVAHHIIDGATTFPYAIDAHSAVSRFPGEWSLTPWSVADVAEARKASGEPVIEPTPEEQAAIDEHAAAVAEANERLKARREKLAAEQAEAALVAADEALVASAPPRPDPTARKPSLTAKQIRQRAAETDDERIVREKAEADAQANPNATLTG